MLITLNSCATQKEVAANLTSAQIMQLGQEAYNSGNYKLAEYYYQTTLTRFGMDTEIYVEAKYEIGHIAMKTKDYEKAYKNFKEVLDIFDAYPAGVLNPTYKTLSKNGLKAVSSSKS